MRVAITGGSGSLGRALMTRLTKDGADRIVTFSRDEQKRAQLARDFSWHPGVKVYAGDIREMTRLVDIFGGCEIVIHAAARKVVSGHPDEAEEMLRTNVYGTQNVVAAARAAGVNQLLFISSDKAVHPEAQAYGLSKAMAERLIIAENARAFRGGLRLSVLRYGNCIGSNGSVLLAWRTYLARGAPLPLTDARMTRFWLSLDQAVGFVLASLQIMRGGEVFVPILPAAPLTRFAEAVAGHQCNFVDIGFRPGGEKLHERLLSDRETVLARRRNGFYIVPPDVAEDARWDTAPWLGESEAFETPYQSDIWRWQATVEELAKMVGGPANE